MVNKMKKTYIIMIIVILAIGIIAGALTFGNSSVERNPDELVTAVGAHGGEPETGFNPIYGWNLEAEPLIQSTLFKRDSDISIDNDLGTDYSVSDDGKKYTVNIRDDVKFHDGSKLTAKDIVFTYNEAAKVGETMDLSNMNKSTVVNDTQIEFRLNKADSTFLSKLTTLGIVPEASYDNETYGEKPIGSGPYKFVQWDKGQQVIFQLNDEYYAKKPYFKKLTILFLDGDAAFAASKKGEVDIAEVPLSYSNENISNMTMKILDSVDARGISLPNVPDIGKKSKDGVAIGNNVTSDESIRKALNYGIDRESIIKGPLHGHGNKSFDGIGNGLPWSNSEAAIEDGDVEEAKRILTEGGWKDTDGDGIVEKDGKKASFNVVYPSEDGTRQAIAISISEQAKKIGIEIVTEGKSWDEIDKDKLSSSVVWGHGSRDPAILYRQYYGEFAGQGYDNFASYNNSVVNEHIDAAMSSSDENTSYSLWNLVSWDGLTGMSPKGDAAWLWTVFVDYSYFVDNTLDISQNTSTVQTHGGDIFGNIYDWKRTNST